MKFATNVDVLGRTRRHSPETRRAAVDMARDPRRTIESIAAELRVPGGTIEWWIHEARRMAREAGAPDPFAAPRDVPDERAKWIASLKAALEQRDQREAHRYRVRPNFDPHIDLLGDPPPGRSALDQRQGAGA